MLIAQRYAKAFFNIAKKDRYLDAAAQDMELLKRLVGESNDFRNFIIHPRISQAKRRDILSKLFSEKINPGTLTFLFFLAQQRRLDKLDKVSSKFEEMYFADQNTVAVKFTSHREIDNQVLEHMCSQLKDKIKKEIRPALSIDESLIGGIKIQIGDQIHDGSIKAILNKFQQNIIHA